VEIVVTAQRREQKLVEVPMSITAISGNQLDRSGNSSIVDALKKVPGVTAFEGFQTGGSSIAIRGITAVGNVSVGASPVGYYVDSVPFGLVRSAAAPDSNAYDLERVEVLRGPQGTLFGAGSPAGTVRVLTHPAELDKFAMKARASVTSVQDGGMGYRGDSALNIPIIDDVLAARLVAGYQQVGGWIDKPNDKNANDGRMMNLRLRTDAKPTSDLAIGLTAWLSRIDMGSIPGGLPNETSRSLISEPISTDFDMLGFKAAYDFSTVTMTSSTSYLDYKINSRMDASAGTLGTNVLTTDLDAKVLAQELTLNSRGQGPWRWTLGGMYRDAEDTLFQIRRNLVTGGTASPYVQPAIYTNESQSYSLFGDITREFADGFFELTGGLRYFEDKVSMIEVSRLSGPPSSAVPGTIQAQPLIRASETFERVSPRIVAAIHPTDISTLYASYAEGFRSGFQQSPALLVFDPSYPPVGPDNLSNYELGAKGELIDGLLSAEVALYYIEWEKIQLDLSALIGTSIQPAILNAGTGSGMGFDAAVSFRPATGLSLNASYSISGVTLDSDVIAATGDVAFREGDRLPLSPKYTAGADIEYAFPVGGIGAEMILSYGASYTSERFTYANAGGSFVKVSGDDFLLMNGRIAFDSHNGWRASIFADNIADKRGLLHTRGLAAFPEWNTRNRPRTVGVQVDFDF
jgi:iron complex outermembrane recepter protein